jgi:hypothetical protein
VRSSIWAAQFLFIDKTILFLSNYVDFFLKYYTLIEKRKHQRNVSFKKKRIFNPFCGVIFHNLNFWVKYFLNFLFLFEIVHNDISFFTHFFLIYINWLYTILILFLVLICIRFYVRSCNKKFQCSRSKMVDVFISYCST